jgi:hypothetical protein
MIYGSDIQEQQLSLLFGLSLGFARSFMENVRISASQEGNNSGERAPADITLVWLSLLAGPWQQGTDLEGVVIVCNPK